MKRNDPFGKEDLNKVGKKSRIESNTGSTQESEQDNNSRSSSVSSSNTIAELRQEREDLVNRLSHAEDNNLPIQDSLRAELIRFDLEWGDLTDNEVLSSDSSDDSDGSNEGGNLPMYDSGFDSPHEETNDAGGNRNPDRNSNQNSNSIENSWWFWIFSAIGEGLNAIAEDL